MTGRPLTAIPPTGADPDLLRGVFGCFPSGVAAVCATIDGEPVGLAVSTFTPVSMEPALVSVCLQNTSTTWPRLRAAASLGVSVLSDSHDLACRQLSRKTGNRFEGLEITATERGALLLAGATAWLECTLADELPAGDHTIALLQVTAAQATPETAPLIFHRSRFRQLVVT